MVTKDSGEEGWGVIINKYRVWEDEKVLELHGDDGCTTMRKYLRPLNWMLKNGKNGKCYIFYRNKNN